MRGPSRPLPSLRRRGFPRAACPWGLGLRWLGCAALVYLCADIPPALAVPADGLDIPQPTRVERFNPDQQACLPQAIRTGFANQLLPFADQPPAVLDQLRRVQREMTRASLARCVAKGLLPPDEAGQLERELGLQAADPPASGAAPGRGDAPRP